jgi:type III secretory pathway lipoprotein EscJ
MDIHKQQIKRLVQQTICALGIDNLNLIAGEGSKVREKTNHPANQLWRAFQQLSAGYDFSYLLVNKFSRP